MLADLLAGAAGTVCLDAVYYLKYRRAGGTDSALAWEFAPVEDWETAPDPGQVAKRVLEGFSQRKLPRPFGLAHQHPPSLGYGSAAGAAYGVPAGSRPTPHPRYGVPLGAVLFAGGYIAILRTVRRLPKEASAMPGSALLHILLLTVIPVVLVLLVALPFVAGRSGPGRSDGQQASGAAPEPAAASASLSRPLKPKPPGRAA